MPENMRNAFKFNIIGIIMGLCLSLIGVELFLRLSGFGYNLIHRLPLDTGAITADYPLKKNWHPISIMRILLRVSRELPKIL